MPLPVAVGVEVGISPFQSERSAPDAAGGVVIFKPREMVVRNAAPRRSAVVEVIVHRFSHPAGHTVAITTKRNATFGARCRGCPLRDSAQLRASVRAHLNAHEYQAEERELAIAVVASVNQGQNLSDLVARRGLTGNPPFGGLIRQGHAANWGDTPAIRVVGPPQVEIDALHRYWVREVNHNLSAAHKVAFAAASLDQPVPNLSSLVFLLEHDGRRVLFTGDARGDRIVQYLDDMGWLDGGPLVVDALKVPHHGSERS